MIFYMTKIRLIMWSAIVLVLGLLTLYSLDVNNYFDHRYNHDSWVHTLWNVIPYITLFYIISIGFLFKSGYIKRSMLATEAKNQLKLFILVSLFTLLVLVILLLLDQGDTEDFIFGSWEVMFLNFFYMAVMIKTVVNALFQG